MKRKRTRDKSRALTRREFLYTSILSAAAATQSSPQSAEAKPEESPGLIAITLDLEMARNFPRWEDTEWDYQKGNLTEETKRYAIEAGRRVKAHGGLVHYFVVGSVLEQADVDWLKKLAAEGHRLGNHTYDHVNVKAKTVAETQFRFARAPWLVAGQTVEKIVRANIEMCSAAMEARLGIKPDGFRTPGGFHNGLHDAPELQRLLLELGFEWVSATYPAHPSNPPDSAPSPQLFDAIARAQAAAQPFIYPSGLVDVPMSPVSDVAAFRNGRWTLEHFLAAIRRSIESVIEQRRCFDFLAHPSVLSAIDPQFRSIELICELVKKNATAARIVSLGEIAKRATPR